MEEDKYLLPCPFCGSSSSIVEIPVYHNKLDESYTEYAAFCKVCGATQNPCIKIGDVVINWNRRR